MKLTDQIRVCKKCGSDFTPSHTRSAYCSKECAVEGGKEATRIFNRKSREIFKKLFYKDMLWKVETPRVEISVLGYKRAIFRNIILPEHRLIMMIHLDRELAPYEHVHHINGNKLDNRIENLEVVSDEKHWIITCLMKENKRLKQKIEDLEYGTN